MKLRWRFLIAFLIIAGLIGGSLVFPSIALNAFINPITRGLWMLFRLVGMVDQQVYWGLLAIVVFAFSLLILPRGSDPSSVPFTPAPPRPKDAVDEWEHLLEGASKSGENRRALQYRLNSLNRKADELVTNRGVDEFVLEPKAVQGRGAAVRRWLGVKKLRRHFVYAEILEPFLAEIEILLEVRNDDVSDENHEHR
ncbi:hypothetical protein LARV_03526 [Longilinea arvoryzae]|uniref:Uncharacterized protein n=1 Tax=Longilinea arvoryzae TaxID=360412 RepID=A0A0S7BMH4_9CHLR|nr:hypothetical protein [Longilinea arvoryzae]GAP15734.1 hypothetical protein LARV_03526 [Longilinea arvoryzae]